MTTATSIRVLVFFADGVEPRVEDLETVDEPIRSPIPFAEVNSAIQAFLPNANLSKAPSHIICDNDKHVDHSKIGPLPDVCRLRHSWDGKAWEKRTVICLAKYHILVTLDEGKERNPWLEMVCGDILLLKLSDAKGPNEPHTYEDIDFGDTEEEKVDFCVKRIAEMRNAVEARR